MIKFGNVLVYCQTSAQHCRDFDMYLGQYRVGVQVRCPACGRFTVSGSGGEKRRSISDSKRLFLKV